MTVTVSTRNCCTYVLCEQLLAVGGCDDSFVYTTAIHQYTTHDIARLLMSFRKPSSKLEESTSARPRSAAKLLKGMVLEVHGS